MRKGSCGLRWFDGKQLVAFLRDGDYAHAGEETAIEKVMERFPKDPDRLILDVGCGQGGTAKYIQDKEWGRVVGIDIEDESIQYAKKEYNDVEFHTVDVLEADKILIGRKFDIICLFNSFYAFSDQLSALKTLRELANDNAQLAIFEYTDLCGDDNPLLDTKNQTAVTIPIRQENLSEMLEQSGWGAFEFVDLSTEYQGWYADLLSKLETKYNDIVERFGDEAHKKAVNRYQEIYDALTQGTLGGGTFYSEAMAPAST